MAQSLNDEIQGLEDKFNSLLIDINKVKTAHAGLTAKLDTAIGNLNAAGTNMATVAGTNFAALWDVGALNSTAGT
jgi:hypothetical protein